MKRREIKWAGVKCGNVPVISKTAHAFPCQKRAARVISDANNQVSSVKLFNSLQWLPFL